MKKTSEKNQKTKRTIISQVGKLLKIFSATNSAISLILAFARGTINIVYFRITRRNVRIRFPFLVYQKVIIHGPGSVFIDRYCSVYPNSFHGLCIVTYTPNALVKIGKHCSLGGLTIRCQKRVEIGDRVQTAYSLIQDSILVHPDRTRSPFSSSNIFLPESIRIGNNVWIGAQCCVLGGTKVGEDSVLSFGTVCYQNTVRSYQLAIGNPLNRPLPIENIQLLKGQS